MSNFSNQICLCIIIVFTWLVSETMGVILIDGKHLNPYHTCSEECVAKSCNISEQTGQPADNGHFMKQQCWSHWLLRWGCFDECKEKCIWINVESLKQNKKLETKYYGKWAFISLLGMQEPASTIFSALNGLANLIMLIKFRRHVPPQAKMYYVIYCYILVNINAWIWSVAFHARDFTFTEKMDYYGAIMVVLYSLFTLCARIAYSSTKRKWWWIPSCFTAISLFYCYHVFYLEVINFDYDYNMAVLVTTGILNTIGWLLFCVINYKKIPSINKALLSSVILIAFLPLEVYDFPPFFYVFDAHSIWHGGTVPVPILFCSFLIEDTKHLMRNSYKRKDMNQNNSMLPWIHKNLQIVVHTDSRKTNGYNLDETNIHYNSYDKIKYL